MSGPKSFDIPKELVWKAFHLVKANKGAPGVDGESIEEFEKDLSRNLYKIWNRMSSGSYFPPPVRMVEIPKGDGRVRTLGVPAVSDRIAQTAVKLYLEPLTEPMFHDDSYGYRPGRSAHDAIGRCRARCWESDWVIDLDIQAFFDMLDHELVIRAVRHHTDLPWVLLYVERWLKAPMQKSDGILIVREQGSPQGSAISPLLANLFMHYAFDMWMSREFPSVPFERYCDDGVVHCKTERQARHVRDAIANRLATLKLELHPVKTRIVYCKDSNRKGSYANEQFTFLGYTFRKRSVQSRNGRVFTSFAPAISDGAKKNIGRTMRGWRLLRRTAMTMEGLGADINATVRGWINYYGRYYKSGLYPLFRQLDGHLVRWVRRKYPTLHQAGKAWAFLRAVAQREPALFAHWATGWES